MIRHFDTFDGASGSLTTAAYWSIGAGNVWTRSGGYVDALTAAAADARALHTTAANLNGGAHAQFFVRTVIRANGGVGFAGVSALGDSTPASSSRVVARYKSSPTPRVEVIVPGYATYTVLLGSAYVGFVANGTIENAFWLVADYQGADPSTGKPVYAFRVFLNGDYLPSSPPYVLNYWSAGMNVVGLEARREALVPSPSIHFLEFRTVDTVDLDHEPAPAIVAEATRTPIVPMVEGNGSSPASFPVAVRVTAVSVKRWSDHFATDIGWDVTTPMFSKARRVISCRWIGSATDAEALRDFFRGQSAGVFPFTITIRALGIGSITAAFLDKALEFKTVGPLVRSCAFRIVELT